MNWLFPVAFGSPNTPNIEYATRYTAGGVDVTAPAGVPGYAFVSRAPADVLETSSVGEHGNGHSLAPLPPVDVLMLARAATDPVAQGTHVYPAKLAALGDLDAGDLVYGHDGALLSEHVGVVP